LLGSHFFPLDPNLNADKMRKQYFEIWISFLGADVAKKRFLKVEKEKWSKRAVSSLTFFLAVLLF
jgi:hypothetical protein